MGEKRKEEEEISAKEKEYRETDIGARDNKHRGETGPSVCIYGHVCGRERANESLCIRGCGYKRDRPQKRIRGWRVV